MDDCQVCGRPAIGNGRVEGSIIPLCNNCKSYATNFSLFDEYKPLRQENQRKELIVCSDYAKKIRQAREKEGLNRKEFAAKLQIKENELVSFEETRIKPTITQAKKLEYTLGIKLLVPEEQGSLEPASKKNFGPPILGDFIKKKGN
ncbi:MAG: multiprotein-bridging factor 1 family protein [Candidatus Micrarchaeota archaeon]